MKYHNKLHKQIYYDFKILQLFDEILSEEEEYSTILSVLSERGGEVE